MRKTFLTIVAASLIVGSTIQIAAAAERYTHKYRIVCVCLQASSSARPATPWPRHLSNSRTGPITAKAIRRSMIPILSGTRRRHRIKRIGPEVAFRESRRQSDQVTGRNHNCRREFQSAPTKTSIGSG